jgi:hypothetical protein
MNKQWTRSCQNSEATLYVSSSKPRLAHFVNQILKKKVAAQQHEFKIIRHYESLLQASESHSVQSDQSNSTATSISLLRLSQNLRALIRCVAGKQSPDEPSSSDTRSSPTPEDDLLAYITDFDWATERETEISRLEQENEHLRQLLGIDDASALQNGLLTDEERERSGHSQSSSISSFPSPSLSGSSFSQLRPPSSSSFYHPSSGSSSIPGSPRPPPSGLLLRSATSSPPIPNLQQPPPLPVLRNSEYSQAMHGGNQGRRSAIFGQRGGRGGGGPFFTGPGGNGMNGGSIALAPLSLEADME